MSTVRRGNWRGKRAEHLATLARAVSQTEAGIAHTVQLWMIDPDARADGIAEALRRSNPATSGVGTSDAYQEVQTAADALRGYEGARI